MTYHPLALAGAGAFLAAVFAALAGYRAAVPVGLGFAFLGLCLLILTVVRPGVLQKYVRPRQLLALALAALAAAFVLLGYGIRWRKNVLPYEEWEGQKTPARIKILDYPQEQNGRYYYDAEVVSPAGEPFSVLFVSALPLECRPYDLLSCEVKFYRFSEAGFYSTRNTQLARGHVLGAYLTGTVSSRAPSTLWRPSRIAAEARHRVGRQINRYLPSEEAGLIRRLMLNQRDGMSIQAQSHFQQIGCSHLLAASGLHMALMAGMVSRALSRLRLRRVTLNLLKGLMLLLYLTMIGFPVSAVRSYIMVFLYLAFDCLGRRLPSVDSLGAAALCICLGDPFSGGDVSFGLSFTATLGILLVQKPLAREMVRPLRPFPRLKGFLSPVLNGLSVTLSAVCFTLPIQLFYFAGLPLITPLANLALAPFIAPLLYLSVAAAGLTYFPASAWLGEPFAFLAGWAARLVLWLAEKLAALPGVFLTLEHGLWVTLILTAALAIWCRRKKLLSKGPEWLVLGALAALALFAGAADLTGEQVTVAVAGNGDAPCVLLIKNHRAAVLSLGGYNSSTASRLLNRENAWAIDSVFLPVRNAEARAMALDLLESRRAKRLILPEGGYLGKDLEKLEIPVEFSEGGFEALEGIFVRYGADGSWLDFTVNGRRFVVELGETGAGRCDVLITGRDESAVEAGMVLLLGEEAGGAGPYVLVDEGAGLLVRTKPERPVSFQTP